ncbi:hypothetical protein PF006_g29538 [Phytophthora fragariae]|uniref:Uncharacterized protein n=1 Tax=Phytophthora fragariae TaxID=53985 RepID=A0A6A3Q5I4_9STRA|nr:hypothetical protein PF006_g29538 [Phytophthora fragariae]
MLYADGSNTTEHNCSHSSLSYLLPVPPRFAVPTRPSHRPRLVAAVCVLVGVAARARVRAAALARATATARGCVRGAAAVCVLVGVAARVRVRAPAQAQPVPVPVSAFEAPLLSVSWSESLPVPEFEPQFKPAPTPVSAFEGPLLSVSWSESMPVSEFEPQLKLEPDLGLQPVFRVRFAP